jgi:hypothetical protein
MSLSPFLVMIVGKNDSARSHLVKIFARPQANSNEFDVSPVVYGARCIACTWKCDGADFRTVAERAAEHGK